MFVVQFRTTIIFNLCEPVKYQSSLVLMGYVKKKDELGGMRLSALFGVYDVGHTHSVHGGN